MMAADCLLPAVFCPAQVPGLNCLLPAACSSLLLAYTLPPALAVLFALGLLAFTVALVVLIWTRWGQYRPLRKCVMLSLLAHLLLAGYATTIEIVSMTPTLREREIRVSLLGEPAGPIGGEAVSVDVQPPRNSFREPIVDKAAQPTVPSRPVPELPAPVPPMAVAPSPQLPAETSESAAEPTQASLPAPIAPAAPPAVVREASVAPRWQPVANEGRYESRVPDPYELRVAPDHTQAATRGGGSPETEAAVQAALKWLIDNQSADGRWDARRHGAGRDDRTKGWSRPEAGVQADSGMTGLALLALLASGHTHLRGEHQASVRRGLEYLIAIQAADGNLGGGADRFAAMYCHAMATFALSEAYGMTGDRRLEATVRRAVGYTVAAQDPLGGGWRYSPRTPGDTSQLGWQFMALHSAEVAGIPIPEATRAGITRYLQSVASGRAGGLASYRPREKATRSMTAEALFCWQLLGMVPDHAAAIEAAEFVTEEPPSRERANFYYWYYGTLAMHGLQGESWQRWNEALRTSLLATQRSSGELAGSWDPDPVWGGYGGRIYSTALGTLCLEVYYRYAMRPSEGVRQ